MLSSQPAIAETVHRLPSGLHTRASSQGHDLMLLMECSAILVTGMSGVGKSTALAGLSRRGFSTVDTDYGPWIHVVDGEPLWREPLVEELLARPRESALFVQGTVANQGRFYHRFDAVVLLSAPIDPYRK